MVITVVGLGFVGLTTALGFAEYGNKVYGVEASADRLGLIQAGRLPFLEPGLDGALCRHLGKSFLPVSPAGLEEAVSQSDYVYYCVGTPYGKDGKADCSYLLAAMDDTVSVISDKRFRVLVTKSTIPPGTCDTVIIPHLEARGVRVGEALGVANNPEFLRQGHCWDDFIHADRIVIGVEDSRSEKMLRELYSHQSSPVFCVSRNTGEFIKYLSNSLLATLVSFSNEMSVIADHIGDVDVASAFRILHMDKRWGGSSMASYVYPGCGYGGYCLPKDTNALYAKARESGFDAALLGNVIRTNDRMPEYAANRIISACDRAARSSELGHTTCIGILGLSFKPGSDDVRYAPSALIINKLLEKGYSRIVAFDPVANDQFAAQYGLPVSYCTSMSEVIGCADVLAILTAWPSFFNLKEQTDKPIVDCRYCLR